MVFLFLTALPRLHLLIVACLSVQYFLFLLFQFCLLYFLVFSLCGTTGGILEFFSLKELEMDELDHKLRSTFLSGDHTSPNLWLSEFSTPAGETPSSEEPETIEEAFEFNRYKKYVNLSCVEVQPDETDPDATPFMSLKKKMTPLTEDGGVTKLILKSGTKTQVIPDGLVKFHHNSYIEMNEVPFDSTYLRQDEPVQINLSAKEIYPGFEIALRSMCVGEKSEFLVEPKYAFGKIGVPPRIPPDATILLEIEVFDSHPYRNKEDKEEVENQPLDVVNEKTLKILGVARDLYNRDQITAAVREYRNAVKILHGAIFTSDDERKQVNELLQRTFINLMTCYNRLEKYDKTLTIVHEIAFVNPDVAKENPKFCFQLAKAQFELRDVDKALRSISRALNLQPNNAEIRGFYDKIKERQLEILQVEKKMCEMALGVSNSDQERPVEEPNQKSPLS